MYFIFYDPFSWGKGKYSKKKTSKRKKSDKMRFFPRLPNSNEKHFSLKKSASQ